MLLYMLKMKIRRSNKRVCKSKTNAQKGKLYYSPYYMMVGEQFTRSGELGLGGTNGECRVHCFKQVWTIM